MNIKDGIELIYHADLPARTGLGSSSSFTVGLLNGLHALQGEMVSKTQLVSEAIDVELNYIKENVGCQDQTAVAHGGFNRINFKQDGAIDVTPVIVKKDRLSILQDHLMLFFTGFTRTASEIAGEQIR